MLKFMAFSWRIFQTMASPQRFGSSANLQLHTPTGSIIPHVLLWAIQPLALASPPFRGRRILSVMTIIALAVSSQVHPHFTNDIALAQPFTISWSVYLATLEKILFAADTGPEASFWHIDKPAREAINYAAFSYQKLRWAIALMFNMRGIRWSHEVKNIQKASTSSRSRFLVTQVMAFLYYGLAADLVVQLGIRWFYTAPDGQVGDLNSKYLTLRHSDWRWSFAKAYIFGATPYFICCMQYTLFSILAVLLGLSKPEVSAMKIRPCHRLDVAPRFLPQLSNQQTLYFCRTGPLFSAKSKKRQLYVFFGADIGIRLFGGYVQSFHKPFSPESMARCTLCCCEDGSSGGWSSSPSLSLLIPVPSSIIWALSVAQTVLRTHNYGLRSPFPVVCMQIPCLGFRVLLTSQSLIVPLECCNSSFGKHLQSHSRIS